MSVFNTGTSVRVELPDGRHVELYYEKDEELDAVRFLVPNEALDDLIALANSL